jgi:hypothetical protein
LISKTPGLVAQSTGTTHETIFVNQASGLDFLYPQASTPAKDTLEAKRAFERFARQHQVTIKHYYCDDDIFASKKFHTVVLNKP